MRVGVCGRTGHDCQRHIFSKSPPHPQEFAQEDFKETGLRHRADRIEPLWPRIAESRALAPRYEDRANGPLGQRKATASQGLGRRRSVERIPHLEAGRRGGIRQIASQPRVGCDWWEHQFPEDIQLIPVEGLELMQQASLRNRI